MMEAYDEVRFWLQVFTDAERTIVCSPELESRLKTQIETRGLSGQLTVLATPVCREGYVYIIDHNAIEASTRELLSKPLKTYDTDLGYPERWMRSVCGLHGLNQPCPACEVSRTGPWMFG